MGRAITELDADGMEEKRKGIGIHSPEVSSNFSAMVAPMLV